MNLYSSIELALYISRESLSDKFNDFFVHKIEEIRSSFDPDRPIPTNPVDFFGTVFAEFQLVTEDFAKTVVQEVLGPLLFTLYTHPLSTVICQSGLSYHFFADDSQLHKSSVPSDSPVLARCLKDCIEYVAEWMGDSKLRMNYDKIDFMAIGTMSN